MTNAQCHAARRAYRIANRLCVVCGVSLTWTDGPARRCLRCEDAHAEANAAYRAKPAVRSRRAEAMAALRADRAARGLCWECANPVEPGRRRCTAHLEAHRLNGKLETVPCARGEARGHDRREGRFAMLEPARGRGQLDLLGGAA